MHRFKAAQQRARSGAGPSLFGSDRSVEHWTFGYARRAIENCLADVSMLVLTFAQEKAVRSAEFEALTAARLQRHIDEIMAALKLDYEHASPNEFGLRPARGALHALETSARQMRQAALAGIVRGKIDRRIVPPAGLVSRSIRLAGGADRVILVTAIVVFVVVIVVSL